MLLTLSLVVFTLAKDSVSLFSPLRVQGAAFRHGFPLAALSCTVTPFWVVMGEHCPRSCSSYSGQCRHLCRHGLRPFMLRDTRTLFVVSPHGHSPPEELQLLLRAALLPGMLGGTMIV